MDHDVGEDSPPAGMQTGRIMHVAGAVGSLVLIAGLVFWAYELAVRDVHGIPVVRALEGPMRVAPAAPGGEVTEHQGLAVNQVAANGMAAPLPETVTLAPRPETLAEEDVAGLLAPQAEAVVTAAAAVPAEPVMPADLATAAAIAAALAEATAMMPDTLPETAPEAAPAAEPAAAVAVLRPRPRPPLPEPLPADPPVAAAAAAPATADAAAPMALPLAEVDAASVAPGTVLIQLDAFDSEADARAAWITFTGRFPYEFADKALLLDRAESGGLPFWRLRAAGFDGVDSARAFCENLRMRGATCIPVAHE